MTRILVVDDEVINRMIITETLVSAGYQIDEADDGDTAWDMMLAQDYDLILLDRMMPRMDGMTLIKRMKQDPRWQATPVILQTAEGAQRQMAEGLDAGAYYYLTKPYNPQMLRMLVGSVVSGPGQKLRLMGKSFEVNFAAAQASGDWKAQIRLAHSLKSAANTLGAKTLAEAAYALQRAAEGRNPARCAELLPRVTNHLNIAVDGLSGLDDRSEAFK